ncbi:Aste57867_21803 [Aphanomyces stellatus]|uniref:NADPH-dependent diflavin oxidoreductase 1 n=1 Tax=Aphanomyces stellatus TaxID=120398 RepID=A0A485LNC7_9STRA|nr:hypothetical protein As57867_021734 [Aphanomyces stellatus]VFT98472.1 Aste57867_21803 [Aphanomyces stellatus]
MLHVLYGSATGTGQDVAEQIGRMAAARNIRSIVSSMDTFDIQELPTLNYVVFVASSTGDGEAPENMSACWKFLLRKSLPADSLQFMQMAVFGLGDSSYAKYNAVARRLQARLLQLGATELIERGLGDDQHELGYHGTLNPWLDKLWAALLCLPPFVLPAGFVIDDTPQPTTPKYTVHVAAHEAAMATTTPASTTTTSSFYTPPKSALSDTLITATVVANDRLTAADWTQDVRHIELDIAHTGVTYSPGDIALLYPENINMADLDALLSLLQLPPTAVLSIARIDGAHDIPSPCSASDLVRKYLDVFGTPRRSFFERLSLFAHDPEEKEKLLELCSPQGADLLHDYCTRERRTYIEVLQDFRSCHVPLEYLLEMIPRLTPRAYSIASSSKIHPGKVQLAVAIVDYKTPYKREKKGVCSAWLETLQPGVQVPLQLKTGLFRLTPAMHAKPFVLIGPGTGIAVMRAIVQERQALVETHADVGPTHVYFGCRHQAKDYIYGAEWAAHVARGTVTSLHVAFSRDQPDKIYVQGKLAEEKAAVFAALAEGYVFVAGSAKRMPTDVYETIRAIVASEGKVTLKEAEAFMKSLIRAKRYVVESWS